MIRRGAIYSASEKGVLTSKPRPVLVVQNDPANQVHSTVTICLVSTTLSAQSLFRVTIAPSAENGLVEPSEVQIDRLFSFRRASLDDRIGILSRGDMDRVEEALHRWLDL